MILHKDVKTKHNLTKFKTLEKELNEAHNSKYDYSKSIYLNSSTKLCIICPEHGEFYQCINKHLTRKQGCVKCTKRAKTNEKFIEEANDKHNNLYDYSKTKYKGSLDKVIITCKEHGDFDKVPAKHLRGQGCMKCSKEKAKTKFWNRNTYKNRITTLYYIKVNNLYKIGITLESVERRFRKDKGVYIEIIKTWVFEDGSLAYDKEQEIIKNNKEFKYLGENILNGGNSELFYEDILSKIII